MRGKSDRHRSFGSISQRKHDTLSVLLQAELIGHSVQRGLLRVREKVVQLPTAVEAVDAEIATVVWLLKDIGVQLDRLHHEFSARLEGFYGSALEVKAAMDVKFVDLLARERSMGG